MAATSGVRRVVLSSVVVAVVIAGGGSMLTGLDRRSSADRITLSAAAAATTTALAAGLDDRLGVPVPASRVAQRLADPATGAIVDEVRDLDATGQPIGISRFEPAGQLVSSVRLGLIASSPLILTTPAAALRGQAIATNAGMAVAGTPAITPRAAGGWLVRWVRTIAGIPVPGDGVSVQLAADGSFHAIARTEHPLAQPPASTLTDAQIRVIAGARLDAWFTGSLHGLASISSVALAWVSPNDTFADPLPLAPAGTLRQAWLVRVTASGALADQLAGLELAFDAGDGTPLGGDVLE